jgi:hypothetical protein
MAPRQVSPVVAGSSSSHAVPAASVVHDPSSWHTLHIRGSPGSKISAESMKVALMVGPVRPPAMMILPSGVTAMTAS